MKTALFVFSFLFATTAFANFHYQPDTIIPLDLQHKIEAFVNENCDYEPQWRKVERKGTGERNGYMSILFDVEAYDMDGMHPYGRTILVLAKSENSVYELMNLACN